jgi:hypothetical protein
MIVPHYSALDPTDVPTTVVIEMILMYETNAVPSEIDESSIIKKA